MIQIKEIFGYSNILYAVYLFKNLIAVKEPYNRDTDVRYLCIIFSEQLLY